MRNKIDLRVKVMLSYLIMCLIGCNRGKAVDYTAPGGDVKTPSQHITDCQSAGQLSLKRQLEKVNEALGTPNAPSDIIGRH